MIPWLDEDTVVFPDIATALQEPDGLLAAGGNLNPATLIEAYKRGIFPWYSCPDPILWWSPDPRCLLKPEEVHISKSMQKEMRKKRFSHTWNSAFEDVMHACGHPRRYSEDTWISEEMITAYCQLHALGVAHSMEVWEDNTMVGGLYGLAIGGAFFGESMFSTSSNSSKYAFISLCQQLQRAGFSLIDCQVESDHLLSLGAYTITRTEFQTRLHYALQQDIHSPPWMQCEAL